MIEQHNRRTKIIKSFEARALTSDSVTQVVTQEVDVLRLVYDRENVQLLRDFVKSLGVQAKKNMRLPVMLDVSTSSQGSIYGLAEPRELSFGDRITVSPAGGKGELQIKTSVWNELFTVASTVFVGYGNVGLKTLAAGPDRVELEVTQGGTIYPGMDLFAPETRHDLARKNVTVEELREVLQVGIDYLVIPDQWPAAKITSFREALVAEHGDAAPWLIAKIDSGECYKSYGDILEVVDGVLISRREIALTVDPATVPMITKEIIQKCNDRAKLVVTASEMLASMRRNPTPTRAEVSDVANAVLDGTDAVVLSEEVANGRYGPQAVSAMHRIICDVEEASGVKPNWIKAAPAVTNEMDAIAYNAYRTAERIQAKAIVCITKAGNTAVKLASFRPPLPIIAVTFSNDVLRRLSLVRGVEGILFNIDPNLDEVLPLVNDHLVRESWLKPGDPIIFVTLTISPVGKEASNLFTIQDLN